MHKTVKKKESSIIEAFNIKFADYHFRRLVLLPKTHFKVSS